MNNCKLIALGHLRIGLFLLAFFFFSCKTNQSAKVPDGLRKLSDEEIIDRARHALMPDVSKVTYMFESGEIIAADSLFTIKVLAIKIMQILKGKWFLQLLENEPRRIHYYNKKYQLH